MARFELQAEAIALGVFEQAQPDPAEITGGDGENLHAGRLAGAGGAFS